MSNAGHGKTKNSWKNSIKRFEKMQNDTHLFRYLLQPGEILGSRAEGSICFSKRPWHWWTGGDIKTSFMVHLNDINASGKILQLSDWDRYAAEEYELLVAEEGGNDDPNSL